MATTTTEQTRSIWKCRNRNCKHVWAFNYTNGYRVTADGKQRSWTMDYMGGCRCPKCNAHTLNGAKVDGTYSDHKCGAKCMGATGPNCDCSCGGANHGRNHLV